MSQIRKLQGGGTPKYGVLRIGNTVYDTPEAINAFENYLRNGDRSFSAITGKWMNYLRNGHDVSIDPISNTINITGVSSDDYADLNGATKRQRRILESGKPTYGRNDFSTNFRNGIYYAGQFSYSKDAPESKKEKIKVSNNPIEIDYDTIDGKQVFSNNPKNKLIEDQIKSYLTYLDASKWKDSKWGEENEWTTNLGDNDRVLKSWYNSFATKIDAEIAIQNALEEVKTKPWNEVSEASKELLEYFNIFGPGSTKKSNGSTSTADKYHDENGQVINNATTDSGKWGVYIGNGENGTVKGATYTTFNRGNIPYLITKDRLANFDLDDSYLNAIIDSNGRIFRQNEIGQDVRIQNLVDDIIRINNSALNATDLYNALKERINYTDTADTIGNYLTYDANQHYISNQYLRKFLADRGISNAAMFDATKAYDLDGDEVNIYGIYDFSHNGTNPYGFRAPYYLIVGKDGNIYSTTNPEEIPYTFLNREYDVMSGIYDRYKYNGKSYGRFTVKDAVTGEEFHIGEDEQGNLYHIDELGVPNLLDDNLKQRILNGEAIVRNDVDVSKAAVKKAQRKARRSAPYEGRTVTRKEGGSIKPLPEKLQGGSKLMTKASTVQDPGKITDPMSEASGAFTYGWDNMSKADRDDVYAVGLDLLGAVLSISPDPYTMAAGVGSGVAATGLMTAADVRRHDFSPWRTGVSLGMDVLGALPVIGTTAKFAKIGKTLAKTPKLWKYLSNGFIAAGFANAVPTLNKLVQEGPKSLTTDDLYALSGALQASLGVGVRARQRAGDSRLANIISNTESGKNVGKEVASVSHSVKSKYASDINVKLKEGEITEIKDAGENAGNVLRKTLTDKYNVDPATIEADNTALLKRFGFEMKEGVPTPIEGTFKLEQDDVDYVLNGGENAGKRLRERLIAKDMDPNLINTDDKALLKEFGFDVKMTKGDNPKIKSIEETKPKLTERVKSKYEALKPGDNDFKKRGYITDLWRGAQKRKDFIDAAMKSETTRAEIDTALAKLGSDEGKLAKRAYGRSQFRIGEEPSTVGWGKRYSWVPSEETTTPEKSVTPSTPKETKIEIPSGKSDERAVVNSNLEASTHSPEEILQLPANTKETALTVKPSEAIEVRPENFKTKRTTNYKQISMDKRASNLRRLQKSMNPLKTLSDLEKSRADKLFTNEEELNAVIQDLIVKNAVTRGNDTKAGQMYMRNLVSKLRSLRDAGRLYKKGGTLKYLIGGPMFTEPLPTGPSITPPSGSFAQATTNSRLQMETINAINAAEAAQKRDQFGLSSNGLGGWYKNGNGFSGYVIPALSAVRYFSQMFGRNKVYDEQKKALRAGEVYRDQVSIPLVPTDSVSYQHYQNYLQQQRMNGLKPVSPNLNAYYAAKLMQDSQINKGLADLTAQRAQFEQHANTQNQQLKSQEALQNNEIGYENRKVRAGINSGLHQLEAARLNEMQASRDNLLYEIQSNMKEDQLSVMQASIAKHKQDNDKKYQAELQRIFKSDWDKYQPVGHTKYTTFEDYVRSENPTAYNAQEQYLKQFKEKLDNELIQTSIEGKLNYPWMYGTYAGYTGPAGMRKGGRLNGTTRYTLEPDERIWIDNNKAAHAKSAKLNDAAIKLLLRALK